MRKDPIESFADDIGEVQRDTDGEGFAEIGGGVVVPADAMMVSVAVIVTPWS